MDNYLLQDTPEGQKMRKNLLELIETYDIVNMQLSFSIMQGSGVPDDFYLVLFFRLKPLPFRVELFLN